MSRVHVLLVISTQVLSVNFRRWGSSSRLRFGGRHSVTSRALTLHVSCTAAEVDELTSKVTDMQCIDALLIKIEIFYGIGVNEPTVCAAHVCSATREVSVN